MNRNLCIGLIGLSFAMPALGQPAPQPSQMQTVQQAFDAGSAALADERWDDAALQFEALEARIAANPRTNARSLAIVRLRRSEALAHLSRFAVATELIQAALQQLPADDASLHEDRLQGLVTLAVVAELSLDYAEAARRYRTAIVAPGPDVLRLQAYRGLIQTLMFDDTAGALAAGDEALARIAAMPDNSRLTGQFRALRGRVLLNAGRLAEARDSLLEAVRVLGGLTNRADAADIAARADLATVYLLLGDRDNARRYLAYTGAGRFRRGFIQPRFVSPVRCGAEVTPDDVAIVEFSVDEDGLVSHAAPIYASRAAAARSFAAAVSRWSFDPGALGGIPPLFLTMARIEMHCSQIQDLPQRGRTYFYPPRGDYGRSDPAPRRAERVTTLRGALDRARAASPQDQLALFDALIQLAYHGEVGPAETIDLLLQALVIARRPDAAARIEPQRIAMILMSRARIERLIQAQSAPGASGPIGPLDPALMLDHPIARENPRVGSALRFLLARERYYMGGDDEAEPLLAPLLTADDRSVEPDVRAEAFDLAAQLRAAAGDGVGARAMLERSRAPARRCPLVSPRLDRTASGRSSDYPSSALRWDFEGWSISEVSVAQDGSVTAARPRVAYPPFVFGEAATEIVRRGRLAPNVTRDGQPCPMEAQRVRFFAGR